MSPGSSTSPAADPGGRHAQHPQPSLGERRHVGVHCGVRGFAEPAQARDRFGRALGRQQDAACLARPHLDEGETFGSQRIGTQRRRAARPRPLRLGRLAHRPIHRIDRPHRGSQRRHVHQPGKARVRRRGARRPRPALSPERGHAHAILGERAGLVDAQQGGGAEGFDHRGSAHQHLVLRQPPGAEREEDRQDHRELFRDQRDPQGDPGQAAPDPVPTHQAVGEDDENAGEQRKGAEPRDQAAGGALQQRRLDDDRRQ